MSAVELVRGQLRLLSERPATAGAERDEAAVLAAAEEAVAHLVYTYGRITRLDEKMHEAFFTGTPYDAALARQVEDAFREWLDGCKGQFLLIDGLEEKGQRVEGADDLRRACRAVAAALTPDSEYFTSDALVKLRDEAAEEHARGETEPLEPLPR